MEEMQCPRCKYEFKIDIDISARAKGLRVFRGRMVSFGKLDSVYDLLNFLSRTPKIHKYKLISKLVNVCGIPKEDAMYIIEQL